MSQPNALLVQHLRLHAVEVRHNRRIVFAQLRTIQIAVQDSLRTVGYDDTLSNLFVLVSSPVHRVMLNRIYLSSGTRAAISEYERLTATEKNSNLAYLLKDKEPGPKAQSFLSVWRARLLALVNDTQTVARITAMTTHTRELVEQVIKQGKEKAYSIGWATKAVANVLTGKSAIQRIDTIANTETTRGLNEGYELGATATNSQVLKQWLARSDAKTRPAHRAMIGRQPIRKEDLFLVGGVGMKFPGDPAGGPANTKFCRCRVVYIKPQEQ